MSQTAAPVQPPSARRLAVSAAVAIGVAAVVLVAFVLPAEYNVDPLGIGGALGLTQINAPARTIEITDVVGGNERVVEAEIPDFGEPVPLPNPAVHQEEDAPPASREIEIEIPPDQETEIKLVMQTSKAVLYSWRVDRGTIYSDFHGHTPEAGQDFFVRYKEHQEGSGGEGSLVAPFAGEHGWYWLNYNEYPVRVTLSVTGYYDDVIDYGIF